MWGPGKWRSIALRYAARMEVIPCCLQDFQSDVCSKKLGSAVTRCAAHIKVVLCRTRDSQSDAIGIACVLCWRSENASLQGGSMLQRPHAAHGTREFVRGSMAAMPFAPGMPSLCPFHSSHRKRSDGDDIPAAGLHSEACNRSMGPLLRSQFTLINHNQHLHLCNSHT